MYKQRPIGVTIIALLAILGGIAFLASGFGTLFIPLAGIFIGSGLFILGLAYCLMATGMEGEELGLDTNANSIWNWNNSRDRFYSSWKPWIRYFILSSMP